MHFQLKNFPNVLKVFEIVLINIENRATVACFIEIYSIEVVR